LTAGAFITDEFAEVAEVDSLDWLFVYVGFGLFDQRGDGMFNKRDSCCKVLQRWLLVAKV
jgi:hypothetical protein